MTYEHDDLVDGDVDEDGAEVKCTTSPCVPKYRRTQRDNNEKKEELEKLNAENQNVHSVRTLSASGCLLSGNVKIIINAIVHGHSTSLERALQECCNNYPRIVASVYLRNWLSPN